MSDYRHYKLRDFDFAHLLVTLRKRTNLTQGDIALRIGISERAIRNWEGGSNYPSGVNLRKLIEIYLHKSVFVSEHEQDEARLLWNLLHERAPHRIGTFDEQWFAALFQEWEARSTSHAQQPAGSQQRTPPLSSKTHPLTLLPAPETAQQAPSPSRPTSRLLRGDWSEALDVSSWYGRIDELAELERWLLTDRCRLVAVLGMGGIGKTTLAVKLVQQVASHFECVLWHSLHNAPSLQDVLHDWLPALVEQHDTSLLHDVDQDLALLIGLLQERRCLLVLDNLETLFQEGVLGGYYRQGYEDYATLIRHVAQTAHHSCLLVTCRELFPDLGGFTGLQGPVRVFRLGGLALPACQQLLQDKGLFGNQAAWSELAQCYAGNPLALKIVAATVYELFGGDIAAFLAEGFTTFRGLRQLLTQQFERLSALEQALMYWLAIERELASLEALRADLWHPVSKRDVVEAMHSLRSRSLVERGEHGAVFTLQPVILEYVTERLVELVSEELRDSRPALLLTHALLKGQAKDYLRTSQAQLIVQPLLDHLVSHFGTPQGLEEQFERLLQQLRALPRAAQGYGGGNVVNLLIRLNGHVKGKNCSHLTVWQADLQGAEAQGTNFTGSDLTGCVFMESIDGISSVALSANGQYLAGGSNNGQIRLWRAMDGHPLLALVGHIRLVWALAFNPESTRLISGGYDGLVKVWEISTGQCVSTLQGHSKWVRSLAVHPEGRLLATCGDDGSIRLWDLTVGRCTRVWHEQASGVWSLAFSPDGKLLASGDTNGVVKLWDLTSEQCLWSITAHHGSAAFSQHGVLSVAFSPDGEVLVSGGQDSRIMVWQTSSGAHLSTLSGHTGRVYSVTFNIEGLLASGSQDCTVKLWQVGHRGEVVQCLGTLHGHTSVLWSVVWGPDGLLASGSQDGVIKVWQISKEGEGGRCLRTLRGYARLINAVAFSPDGQHLVSSESNGTVRIWEMESGRCLRILSRQAGGSFAVAFSPDGRLFAHALSDNNTIKLWDVASGQCLQTLQGHQGEIWSVAFSPDECFLVSGSLDRTIKVWEASSGQCLRTLQGHRNWVWSLACSPDGKLLASGDVDGVVKAWDLTSGQCLCTLQGSPKAIMALAFTPDGTMLLSSNAQDLVVVWDVKSGHSLKTLPGSVATYWLGSVAFSADGSLLAAGCNDQTVRVWDVSSGEQLRTFPCHAGRLWSVAFNGDGSTLASVMEDGTIMLWESRTGKCFMILQCDRPYERMNISGVTGLTEARKVSLQTLGAIEEDDETKP